MTIAIANQKGGVGKTTTCLNLGHALADLNQRVLLVDFDPQSSLTIALGLDLRQLPATIYNVLLENMPGVTLRDIVCRTRIDRVDVVPASLDLAQAESELFSEMNRERALGSALGAVVADYDYVLIDCPPNLGLLTTNALSAADAVIIPIESDYLALRGAQLILTSIEKIRRKLHPGLTVMGALATKHDRRTTHAREMLDEIKSAFGDRTFKSVVRYSVRAKESVITGDSILTYDPKSQIAESYRALAQEILDYAEAA